MLAVLVVLAAALVYVAGHGVPAARAQTATAEKGDVFVCAGQVTSNSYGLYLVDLGRNVICVYQWLPNSRKLRFMAARNYTYDLKLDDYNTEEHPRDIKKLAEQSKPLGD